MLIRRTFEPVLRGLRRHYVVQDELVAAVAAPAERPLQQRASGSVLDERPALVRLGLAQRLAQHENAQRTGAAGQAKSSGPWYRTIRRNLVHTGSKSRAAK